MRGLSEMLPPFAKMDIFLILLFSITLVNTAPVQEGVKRPGRVPRMQGCFYNAAHFDNGEQIITNEPCLNCTCVDSTLMCYLRVCPFVKPVGEECIEEKAKGDCCPKIWCPEVVKEKDCDNPKHEGKHDHPGCYLNDKYYPDGAMLPHDPKKPCEVCYCIRNSTSCVVQECELKVDGCSPVYKEGQCCPCRYNCSYDASTTIAPSGVTVQDLSEGCVLNDGKFVEDGEAVNSTNPCEHCYCMRNEVVCAIQECQAPGDNCTPLPPKPGQCCPDRYECPSTPEADSISFSSVFTSEDETTPQTPNKGYNIKTSSQKGIGIKGVASPVRSSPKPVGIKGTFDHSKSSSSINTLSDISDSVPADQSKEEITDPIHHTKEVIDETSSQVSETSTAITEAPSLPTSPSKEHEETTTIGEIYSSPSSSTKLHGIKGGFQKQADSKEASLKDVSGVKGHPQKSGISTRFGIKGDPENIRVKGKLPHNSSPALISPTDAEKVKEDANDISSSIDLESDSQTAESLEEHVLLVALQDKKEENPDDIKIQNSLPVGILKIKGQNKTTVATVTGIFRPGISSEAKTDQQNITGPSEKVPAIKHVGVKGTPTSEYNVKGSQPGYPHRVRPMLPIGAIPGEHPIPVPTRKRPVIMPIPGEGGCRIGKVTYRNGQTMASFDACKTNCQCINSVVYCDDVVCETPSNVHDCVRIRIPGECCPRYQCRTSTTLPTEPTTIKSETPTIITSFPFINEKTESPESIKFTTSAEEDTSIYEEHLTDSDSKSPSSTEPEIASSETPFDDLLTHSTIKPIAIEDKQFTASSTSEETNFDVSATASTDTTKILHESQTSEANEIVTRSSSTFRPTEIITTAADNFSKATTLSQFSVPEVNVSKLSGMKEDGATISDRISDGMTTTSTEMDISTTTTEKLKDDTSTTYIYQHSSILEDVTSESEKLPSAFQSTESSIEVDKLLDTFTDLSTSSADVTTFKQDSSSHDSGIKEFTFDEDKSTPVEISSETISEEKDAFYSTKSNEIPDHSEILEIFNTQSTSMSESILPTKTTQTALNSFETSSTLSIPSVAEILNSEDTILMISEINKNISSDKEITSSKEILLSTTPIEEQKYSHDATAPSSATELLQPSETPNTFSSESETSPSSLLSTKSTTIVEDKLFETSPTFSPSTTDMTTPQQDSTSYDSGIKEITTDEEKSIPTDISSETISDERNTLRNATAVEIPGHSETLENFKTESTLVSTSISNKTTSTALNTFETSTLSTTFVTNISISEDTISTISEIDVEISSDKEETSSEGILHSTATIKEPTYSHDATAPSSTTKIVQPSEIPVKFSSESDISPLTLISTEPTTTGVDKLFETSPTLSLSSADMTTLKQDSTSYDSGNKEFSIDKGKTTPVEIISSETTSEEKNSFNAATTLSTTVNKFLGHSEIPENLGTESTSVWTIIPTAKSTYAAVNAFETAPTLSTLSTVKIKDVENTASTISDIEIDTSSDKVESSSTKIFLSTTMTEKQMDVHDDIVTEIYQHSTEAESLINDSETSPLNLLSTESTAIEVDKLDTSTTLSVSSSDITTNKQVSTSYDSRVKDSTSGEEKSTVIKIISSEIPNEEITEKIPENFSTESTSELATIPSAKSTYTAVNTFKTDSTLSTFSTVKITNTQNIASTISDIKVDTFSDKVATSPTEILLSATATEKQKGVHDSTATESYQHSTDLENLTNESETSPSIHFSTQSAETEGDALFDISTTLSTSSADLTTIKQDSTSYDSGIEEFTSDEGKSTSIEKISSQTSSEEIKSFHNFTTPLRTTTEFSEHSKMPETIATESDSMSTTIPSNETVSTAIDKLNATITLSTTNTLSETSSISPTSSDAVITAAKQIISSEITSEDGNSFQDITAPSRITTDVSELLKTTEIFITELDSISSYETVSNAEYELNTTFSLSTSSATITKSPENNISSFIGIKEEMNDAMKTSEIETFAPEELLSSPPTTAELVNIHDYTTPSRTVSETSKQSIKSEILTTTDTFLDASTTSPTPSDAVITTQKQIISTDSGYLKESSSEKLTTSSNEASSFIITSTSNEEKDPEKISETVPTVLLSSLSTSSPEDVVTESEKELSHLDSTETSHKSSFFTMEDTTKLSDDDTFATKDESITTGHITTSSETTLISSEATSFPTEEESLKPSLTTLEEKTSYSSEEPSSEKPHFAETVTFATSITKLSDDDTFATKDVSISTEHVTTSSETTAIGSEATSFPTEASLKPNLTTLEEKASHSSDEPSSQKTNFTETVTFASSIDSSIKTSLQDQELSKQMTTLDSEEIIEEALHTKYPIIANDDSISVQTNFSNAVHSENTTAYLDHTKVTTILPDRQTNKFFTINKTTSGQLNDTESPESISEDKITEPLITTLISENTTDYPISKKYNFTVSESVFYSTTARDHDGIEENSTSVLESTTASDVKLSDVTTLASVSLKSVSEEFSTSDFLGTTKDYSEKEDYLGKSTVSSSEALQTSTTSFSSETEVEDTTRDITTDNYSEATHAEMTSSATENEQTSTPFKKVSVITTAATPPRFETTTNESHEIYTTTPQQQPVTESTTLSDNVDSEKKVDQTPPIPDLSMVSENIPVKTTVAQEEINMPLTSIPLAPELLIFTDPTKVTFTKDSTVITTEVSPIEITSTNSEETSMHSEEFLFDSTDKILSHTISTADSGVSAHLSTTGESGQYDTVAPSDSSLDVIISVDESVSDSVKKIEIVSSATIDQTSPHDQEIKQATSQSTQKSGDQSVVSFQTSENLTPFTKIELSIATDATEGTQEFSSTNIMSTSSTNAESDYPSSVKLSTIITTATPDSLLNESTVKSQDSEATSATDESKHISKDAIFASSSELPTDESKYVTSSGKIQSSTEYVSVKVTPTNIESNFQDKTEASSFTKESSIHKSTEDINKFFLPSNKTEIPVDTTTEITRESTKEKHTFNDSTFDKLPATTDTFLDVFSTHPDTEIQRETLPVVTMDRPNNLVTHSDSNNTRTIGSTSPTPLTTLTTEIIKESTKSEFLVSASSTEFLVSKEHSETITESSESSNGEMLGDNNQEIEGTPHEDFRKKNYTSFSTTSSIVNSDENVFTTIASTSNSYDSSSTKIAIPIVTTQVNLAVTSTESPFHVSDDMTEITNKYHNQTSGKNDLPTDHPLAFIPSTENISNFELLSEADSMIGSNIHSLEEAQKFDSEEITVSTEMLDINLQDQISTTEKKKHVTVSSNMENTVQFNTDNSDKTTTTRINLEETASTTPYPIQDEVQVSYDEMPDNLEGETSYNQSISEQFTIGYDNLDKTQESENNTDNPSDSYKTTIEEIYHSTSDSTGKLGTIITSTEASKNSSWSTNLTESFEPSKVINIEEHDEAEAETGSFTTVSTASITERTPVSSAVHDVYTSSEIEKTSITSEHIESVYSEKPTYSGTETNSFTTVLTAGITDRTAVSSTDHDDYTSSETEKASATSEHIESVHTEKHIDTETEAISFTTVSTAGVTERPPGSSTVHEVYTLTETKKPSITSEHIESAHSEKPIDAETETSRFTIVSTTGITERTSVSPTVYELYNSSETEKPSTTSEHIESAHTEKQIDTETKANSFTTVSTAGISESITDSSTVHEFYTSSKTEKSSMSSDPIESMHSEKPIDAETETNRFTTASTAGITERASVSSTVHEIYTLTETEKPSITSELIESAHSEKPFDAETETNRFTILTAGITETTSVASTVHEVYTSSETEKSSMTSEHIEKAHSEQPIYAETETNRFTTVLPAGITERTSISSIDHEVYTSLENKLPSMTTEHIENVHSEKHIDTETEISSFTTISTADITERTLVSSTANEVLYSSSETEEPSMTSEHIENAQSEKHTDAEIETNSFTTDPTVGITERKSVSSTDDDVYTSSETEKSSVISEHIESMHTEKNVDAETEASPTSFPADKTENISIFSTSKGENVSEIPSKLFDHTYSVSTRKYEDIETGGSLTTLKAEESDTTSPTSEFMISEIITPLPVSSIIFDVDSSSKSQSSTKVPIHHEIYSTVEDHSNSTEMISNASFQEKSTPTSEDIPVETILSTKSSLYDTSSIYTTHTSTDSKYKDTLETHVPSHTESTIFDSYIFESTISPSTDKVSLSTTEKEHLTEAPINISEKFNELEGETVTYKPSDITFKYVTTTPSYFSPETHDQILSTTIKPPENLELITLFAIKEDPKVEKPLTTVMSEISSSSSTPASISVEDTLNEQESNEAFSVPVEVQNITHDVNETISEEYDGNEHEDISTQDYSKPVTVQSEKEKVDSSITQIVAGSIKPQTFESSISEAIVDIHSSTNGQELSEVVKSIATEIIKKPQKDGEFSTTVESDISTTPIIHSTASAESGSNDVFSISAEVQNDIHHTKDTVFGEYGITHEDPDASTLNDSRSVTVEIDKENTESSSKKQIFTESIIPEISGDVTTDYTHDYTTGHKISDTVEHTATETMEEESKDEDSLTTVESEISSTLIIHSTIAVEKGSNDVFSAPAEVQNDTHHIKDTVSVEYEVYDHSDASTLDDSRSVTGATVKENVDISSEKQVVTTNIDLENSNKGTTADIDESTVGKEMAEGDTNIHEKTTQTLDKGFSITSIDTNKSIPSELIFTGSDNKSAVSHDLDTDDSVQAITISLQKDYVTTTQNYLDLYSSTTKQPSQDTISPDREKVSPVSIYNEENRTHQLDDLSTVENIIYNFTTIKENLSTVTLPQIVQEYLGTTIPQEDGETILNVTSDQADELIATILNNTDHASIHTTIHVPIDSTLFESDDPISSVKQTYYPVQIDTDLKVPDLSPHFVLEDQRPITSTKTDIVQLVPSKFSGESSPAPGWVAHPLQEDIVKKLSTIFPSSPATFVHEIHNSSDSNDFLPQTQDEERVCYFEGGVYLSSEQIPRKDSCEFCFCFKGDIICLQQTCPPPIKGCYAIPIEGFCCPRFHCPVKQEWFNVSSVTTTTLVPYGHVSQKTISTPGCQVEGKTYRLHQVVKASSNPCMICRCDYGGIMKCDPRSCKPDVPIIEEIAQAYTKKRR